MKRLTMNPFLRGALSIDAIGSGALGALLLAAPARLAGLFNLPQPMLFYLGLFFVVYASCVALLATRDRPPAVFVWIVIVGNVAWLLQSVALALSDWVAPTALGYTFVLAQALAVGVFAELQFIGVRKAQPLAEAVV